MDGWTDVQTDKGQDGQWQNGWQDRPINGQTNRQTDKVNYGDAGYI